MTGLINQFNRTRIAPTPSGFLHLGNILCFAITSAIARKEGAKILLRIDDLDRTRVNKLYIEDIFNTLDFLGISWDEGPQSADEFERNYSQLHRIAAYNDALKQLCDDELVFACVCSRSRLGGENTSTCNCLSRKISLDAENVSWHLLTSNNSELAIRGYNGQIINATLPPHMHNFIVRKKDGFPSYQLASFVDDIFYGVDLIVRGEDLWPSTLAQHELAIALKKDNFQNITFYHHPLLMESSGKKLSKSAGATSINYLRKSGRTPADIYNLIAAMSGINQLAGNWEELGAAMLAAY